MSNNVWLRALMQSDCLYRYLPLFFEHYNRILLCDWVPGCYSVRGRIISTLLTFGCPSNQTTFLFANLIVLISLRRTVGCTRIREDGGLHPEVLHHRNNTWSRGSKHRHLSKNQVNAKSTRDARIPDSKLRTTDLFWLCTKVYSGSSTEHFFCPMTWDSHENSGANCFTLCVTFSGKTLWQRKHSSLIAYLDYIWI